MLILELSTLFQGVRKKNKEKEKRSLLYLRLGPAGQHSMLGHLDAKPDDLNVTHEAERLK